MPDYMVASGTTYRLITDQLGSIRQVVNASTGAVAQELTYDPFGEVASDSNPGFQPFGFAGGLYEPKTGLTHFGAREYDAELGRWTSSDPIGFAGGDTNLYGYVIQDPVNLVDPSGLYPLDRFFPQIQLPEINWPKIRWPSFEVDEKGWPFREYCYKDFLATVRAGSVGTGSLNANSSEGSDCADDCDDGDDVPNPEPPEGGGGGGYFTPTPSPGWDPKPVPRPFVPSPWRIPIPIPG